MNEKLKHYLDAKANFDLAKGFFAEAEDNLIASLPHKPEGARTSKVDGYTVTITGRINRKIDAAAWELIKPSIPAERWPVAYKPDLVISAMRSLQESYPHEYKRFSECLTATPGKPSVSVTIKKGVKNGL